MANRCYVYLTKTKKCRVCGTQLINEEYRLVTKKNNVTNFMGKYCPKCNAFVIKYGNYESHRDAWQVLNFKELSELKLAAARKEKDRMLSRQKKRIQKVNRPDPLEYTYYVASEKTKIRENDHLARNLTAKKNKIREEKEREKREELKKKIEEKEQQRIEQLREFEKKKEKEYRRRLAESRARHNAKKHQEKQARRIEEENKKNTLGKATSTGIKKKERIGDSSSPSVISEETREEYRLRTAKVTKDLITYGLLKPSATQVNNNLKASNKNGDHIITAHDFVVRRTVFKCKHNKHHIEDVKAVFTTITRQGTVNKITIPAGYCSTCNMYFIMESTYKRIKNSGIPICRTMDEKSYENNNSTGLYNNNLASESVLMQFGYNVSKQDDLPAEQRRRILAAIVDNKVLKRNEVVSYLDYFINQRKNQKNKDGSLRYKDAMDKWRMDRAWINQYKLGSYKEVLIRSIVDG